MLLITAAGRDVPPGSTPTTSPSLVPAPVGDDVLGVDSVNSSRRARNRSLRSPASHSSSTRPRYARRRCARPRGAARADAGAASPRALRRRGRRAPSDGWQARSAARPPAAAPTLFTRRQSSTAGRSPAACAIAGMWIRRSSRRSGVDEHRVLDRLVGHHVTERAPVAPLRMNGAGGAPRNVEPDVLPGRRERRMGHCEAESLGHDLRRRCRSEKLAAAPGRGACPAAEVCCRLQVDQAVGAERLHRACVLPVSGQGRRRARWRRRDRGTTPAPSSSQANPCRRCRCRSPPASRQAADESS